MTKLLLDSGDPNEYKEICKLARDNEAEIWGSTTNPSLIAKDLAGHKYSKYDAFEVHQKEIVLQIADLVPGAVSAEVYADHNTKADEMIRQGREIATWHKRVVVKLPTTIEGFKARTVLRKEHIPINNTLVFSQQQVFAICMHEVLIQKEFGPLQNMFPPFISPFLGRLDDKGLNGISFLKEALTLTHSFFPEDLVWMLEASVRNVNHIRDGIQHATELITVPAKIYREWFALPLSQHIQPATETDIKLADVPMWTPTDEQMHIPSLDVLFTMMTSGELDITHELTTAGIDKFVADWQTILAD